MPELPEVQSIVSGLISGTANHPPLTGLKIISAQLFWPRTLALPDPEEFSARVIGQRIAEIGRRGKFVVFSLDRDTFERGVALTRTCQGALKQAEQRVALLLRKPGQEPEIADFEPRTRTRTDTRVTTPAPAPLADAAAIIARYQARIEPALERWLPPTAAQPGRLHEAMRYSVLGSGKRIRPVLCYAAGAALGLPAEQLDGPAAAVS